MVRCTLLASYSIVSKVERRYKIPNPLSTLTLNSLESESEFAHTQFERMWVSVPIFLISVSLSLSRPYGRESWTQHERDLVYFDYDTDNPALSGWVRTRGLCERESETNSLQSI